jgi:2-methylisocitrate lyase-like PEP mutase family enzyme
MTFTVNARTDPYLTGHPEAFAESVRRANLYREAGADCLFVPGALDAEAIGALVREIDGPLNVVMGLAGGVLSVAELRDLGVRRISLGGSLCRATFGLMRRAARQMLDAGSFAYAADAIPHAEMDALFEG